MFSVPISDGLTRITGKFNEFSIEVELVENDITKSRISANIKVASIDTGMPARDEDLKTKTFFDAASYPEITFVSKSISKKKRNYVVLGVLQMHGISKEIEIPFVITGRKGEDVIGFKGTCLIKRSDFGIASDFKHTTDDNFLGNEIPVELDFWTRKPKEKK
jgi:polyisoprenoid-binding protein YceI